MGRLHKITHKIDNPSKCLFDSSCMVLCCEPFLGFHTNNIMNNQLCNISIILYGNWNSSDSMSYLHFFDNLCTEYIYILMFLSFKTLLQESRNRIRLMMWPGKIIFFNYFFPTLQANTACIYLFFCVRIC